MHDNLDQATVLFARYNYSLKYWSTSASRPMQREGQSPTGVQSLPSCLIWTGFLPTSFPVSSLHGYDLLLLTPSFSSQLVTRALDLFSVLHVIWPAPLYFNFQGCFLLEFVPWSMNFSFLSPSITPVILLFVAPWADPSFLSRCLVPKFLLHKLALKTCIGCMPLFSVVGSLLFITSECLLHMPQCILLLRLISFSWLGSALTTSI